MLMMRLVLCILLLPSLAAAQGRGIFIDGAALFGVRVSPSAEGDPTLFGLSGGATYEWNDLNGDRRWQPGEEGALFPSGSLHQTSKGRIAPGASVALGVFATPSVSLRLETTFQGAYETALESGSLLADVDTLQRESAADFTAAAGWHQDAGRATIAYLGGIVFRRLSNETTLSYTSTRRNTISPTGSSFISFPQDVSYQQAFSSTSYDRGVMVGVDVAVRVSRHFAIVPQVRMVAFAHDWNIRPAVALRWRQ